MEAITLFAETYRVRIKKDSCGELIIPGSLRLADMPERLEYASHLYEYGDGRRFGVLLTFQSKKGWTDAKRVLLAAGFTVVQDGDTEGTALFDPHDDRQARLALKFARVRPRRTLSKEQREALSVRMQHARRFKTRNQGTGIKAVFSSAAME
jgi:hypothetical protein